LISTHPGVHLAGHVPRLRRRARRLPLRAHLRLPVLVNPPYTVRRRA